ncbi:MAG: VTT domain-containing protein [Candidatus Omnitrophota bacterium]
MNQKTKNIFKTFLKIILFAAFILVIIYLGIILSDNMEEIKAFLKSIPYTYSSIAFVVLYILANFVFFADIKDLLKPIGAVIFGAYVSTFLIYIAEIVNAFIFFNLSRILGMKFAERIMKGKFHKFYEKLSNISFRWIFILRFVPLVPFRILDVSFGLSKVSFKKYIWAVIFGSPLRIFWIQFILAAIGGFSFAKMMAYYRENTLISMLTLGYFGIAVLIAVRIKRKLA